MASIRMIESRREKGRMATLQGGELKAGYLNYSSQTARKPAKGASESHQVPLGNWASLACQSGVKGARVAGLMSAALSWKVPPRRTGTLPARGVHHSPTFPSMS